MMKSTHLRPSSLVVAGLHGDSGKTLVSLGLALLLRNQGVPVQTFKKGPDYIDAAWLAWASGHPARNLDTFLMKREGALSSFGRHAATDGINIIEGNRGLYDGFDAAGTHSTAELAKSLGAPIVLVVDAAKMTRTAAALVLGCQKMDPDARIAAIILNEVSTTRHEQVLREAIESTCSVPVLGVIPRLSRDALLPARHLGLVTPEEHPRIAELRGNILSAVQGRLDVDGLMHLAGTASGLELPFEEPHPLSDGHGLKVGFLKDSAFTFYYPENLEALESAGASLSPVSSLSSSTVPGDLSALYIGGGFPETHAAMLSANVSFLRSLKEAAGKGLPIYAECGGLMLLAQAIRWQGLRHPMSGVFSFEVELCSEPQGHGYVSLQVDHSNPFFSPGTELRGHEFHYSRILDNDSVPPTACAVRRGSGAFAKRDGIIERNVWASYTHLHAAATPEWAAGLLGAARRFESRC
jgi:cobyrinic acid a,c-diamide synthase